MLVPTEAIVRALAGRSPVSVKRLLDVVMVEEEVEVTVKSPSER